MDSNNITKSNKAVVTNQFPRKGNGLSITSLVFGILSLLFCWAVICPIITGIIGIIIGIISLVKKRDGSNLAIAGIITSILGLLIGTLLLLLIILSEKLI
ncbi:protein of unknown function [Clostridium cavendishii DSM 21758]|uniref:DUF4190 domain-containing protein n=1 Tax=Clostridium cavendishii DSM 21758 TaxID=1121302 RepID=A0A1M6GTQ1_9CLOT|nr:DUF4190 domain-containing protein [Clostridium cavendishii]SHJ13333.1 protein of unknown function [Clostridium cavendishii DSM 21758]